MEEKHQIKLVKKEAMIVAGKVLSHPTLYRMAADSTETSLKVLPRFAIYNRLNAWGRHRDMPQPAKETFHDWYKKHRSKAAETGGKSMSFRDTILQNVRNNQPSSRELPAIPKFHSEQPVDLKKQFVAALKELTGEVVTEPPADFEKFLRNRFPDAKTICSAVPEYAGNREPEDFARWSDASSIDVTIVRSPLAWPKPVRSCFRKKSSASTRSAFLRTTL